MTAPSTKFDEPFTLQLFLKELIPDYDNGLARIKTPAGLRSFLMKQPNLKTYSPLFTHPDFETRWAELYELGRSISSTTMRDAAYDIKTFMEKKNFAVQHFRNYPQKPLRLKDVMATADDEGLSERQCLEMVLNDMKRFRSELQLLQSNEQRYTPDQRNFLSKRISLAKKEIEKMEVNLSKMPQQAEKRKKTDDAVVENLEMPPAKKRGLVAVDFFKAMNPGLSENEQYEKFCYLSESDRSVYELMEERHAQLAVLFNKDA
uniref:Uncharacterized protein n=1 Tax=Panagrellus redivivus TaxID=6233 RepID=A0A7E4UUM3_PANRE